MKFNVYIVVKVDRKSNNYYNIMTYANQEKAEKEARIFNELMKEEEPDSYFYVETEPVF